MAELMPRRKTFSMELGLDELPAIKGASPVARAGQPSPIPVLTAPIARRPSLSGRDAPSPVGGEPRFRRESSVRSCYGVMYATQEKENGRAVCVCVCVWYSYFAE